MKTINGYKLLEEPKYSTCGQLCKASKDRKTYLLKFFQNPVEPVASIMDEKTYAKNKASFEEHKRRRTQINQRMRKISGAGGNIVAPIEEFVEDGRWVEVTPFLADAVDPDQVLTIFGALDRDAQLMALKSLTANYVALHAENIVHGDPKLTNTLLRKNSADNHVFAIIDFDGAFLTTDVPMENIVASLEYYSPEMGLFSNMDMGTRAANRSMLTTKHDIFCLGLIFHQLLTGGKMPIPDELPPHLEKRRAKGKVVYLYTVLVSGDDEHAYQAQIAPEIEPNMAALLRKMLSADAAERPTANQVLTALNMALGSEEMELPDAPFLWNRERLLADGYTRVEAVERFGREGYQLSGFARNRFMVPYRLLELGYASDKVEDNSFEESILVDGDGNPWPEHHIAFNRDVICRKGLEVHRAVRNGSRGYRLKGADGMIRFIPCGTLCLLGLAKEA